MTTAEGPSDRPATETWLRVDRIAHRFDDAWQTGPEPDIDGFLPESGPDRLPVLTELAHIDLERRLKAGQAARAEDYLRQYAELREAQDAAVELIAAEYALRRRLDPDCDVGEYLRRFPEYAEQLPGRLAAAAPAGAGAGGMPVLDEPATVLDAQVVRPPNGEGAPAPWAAGLPPLPDYEILGCLGRGGMGIVYKARHLPLKRIVALKMILGSDDSEPELVARFRREAEALARLHHPHIVQVYEVGEQAGQPYFSLEFMEGGSLNQKIRGAAQPTRQAAELVETLARAVQAAHEQGVVHRDLKPANVLLASDGTPKITDFGLAKQLDRGTVQTESGRILGTPAYMAPEQAFGRVREVGPPADVYALGVILYELLTGRVPFLGENRYHTLAQVCTHEPVSPRRLQPAVPRDLEKVCLKCLEKDPARRYARALDLADDLRRFLNGEPVRARLLSPVGRALKWARRHPGEGVAAFALVLAAVGGVTGGVFRSLYRAEQTAQKLAVLQKRDDIRTASVALWGLGRAAKAAGNLPAARDYFVQALAKLDAEPGADGGDGRLIRQDLDDVKRQIKEADKQQEWNGHLARMAAPFREASFHEIGLTDLHGISITAQAHEDDRVAARRAARAVLAEFRLSAEDPPAEAARWLKTYEHVAASPQQLNKVAADCYHVLLIWAEAESPPGAIDKAGAERALHLLDLAAALAQAHDLPTPRAYHLRRARYLAVAGREGDAQAEQRRAGGMEPNSALDLFLTALESYRRAEFATTAATCERVLRLEPDHLWAQYLELLCHVRSKRWGEAKAEATACLSRQPNFYWAEVQRATAESQLGHELGQREEFQAAEKDFAEVLARANDPRLLRGVAFANRGIMWFWQKQRNRAVADFQQAIALGLDNPETYRDLAYAYRDGGDWKAAVAALDQALARRPNDALLFHTRAELYLAHGNAAAAWCDFEQAIAREPAGSISERLASDYVERGHLQHEAGQYDAALASFAEALRIQKDFPAAHRLRAETLLKLGRYDEAGKALDLFLRDGKPSAKVYQVRGLICAGLHQYTAAVEAYGRSLALQQDANTLAYRGWAYLKLDAPRLAVADFDTALQLDRAQADALCGRGLARVRLGQLAPAVADAEACLRDGPSAALLHFDAACIYALSVGELEKRGGAPLGPGSLAARYQERAVDLLREALAQVPEGRRREFWQANVAPSTDLTPIRRSTSFLELARGYTR